MDILIGSLLCEDGLDDIHKKVQRLLGVLSPGRIFDRDQFIQLLASPLFRILVARKSHPQNIVGMAYIIYIQKLGETIAEIHDVIVDPVCRGEGIGVKLVSGLINDARRYATEIGSDIVISLTSKPSRVAANRMYIKLGFTLVARHLRKNKKDFGTNLYRMTVTPAP